MLILGLDLGTTVGWALRHDTGTFQSGTWDLREAGDDVGKRMLMFKEMLWEKLHDNDNVGAVAYEDVSFAVGQGGKIIGYQTGILLAECADRFLLCANVAVPSLKKFATGNGRAKKPDMIVAARGYGADPQDDNEADAVCVAEWLAQNVTDAD